MNIKDFLFFVIISLTAAVAANHYFVLDIEFLNNIENTLISSGQRGKFSTYGEKAYTPECERALKNLYDAKTTAHADLATAKSKGDVMKIREAEARLEQLLRKGEAACK